MAPTCHHNIYTREAFCTVEHLPIPPIQCSTHSIYPSHQYSAAHILFTHPTNTVQHTFYLPIPPIQCSTHSIYPSHQYSAAHILFTHPTNTVQHTFYSAVHKRYLAISQKVIWASKLATASWTPSGRKATASTKSKKERKNCKYSKI